MEPPEGAVAGSSKPEHHVDDSRSGSPGGRRRRRLLIGLCAVLLLAGGVGWLAWSQAAHAGRIAPGVRVFGRDLGGLTADQARTVIETEVGKRGLLIGVLRVGEDAIDLPLQRLGITVDAAATVRAAERRGRVELPLGVTMYVGGGGGRLPATLRVDPERFVTGLVVVRDLVDVPARDASLRLLDGRVVVVPSADGVAVDDVALERAILAAVAAGRPYDGPVPTVSTSAAVTTASAEQRAGAAAAYLRRPLVLRYRHHSVTLSAARLAQLLSVNGGADADEAPLTFDNPAAVEALHKAFAFVERAAVNATVQVRRGQVFITHSRDGQAVDMERLIEDMDAAAGGEGLRTVYVRVEAVAPRTTTEALQELGLTALGSEFTTYFDPDNRSRAANIERCAELVDGTMVRAGRVFSLNETVGPRTLNRGFDYAPVIVDGVLQQGVGGGVCQFATTLFNAVFFAGLPVVERHPHQFAIEHYPVGRDAAVAWGVADLRFRNDTGRTLMVRAWARRGSLTVVIVGATRRTVKYGTGKMRALRAPVHGRRDPRVVTDGSISHGVVRWERGASGYSLTVSRTVTANGRVLFRDRFFSAYEPKDWVKRIGTRTE